MLWVQTLEHEELVWISGVYQWCAVDGFHSSSIMTFPGERLLRISSTHKLDYLLRCVPPDAMNKLAEKFDDDLLHTFTKKLDIQSQFDRPGVNKEQLISQIQLPIDKGGFGISSAKSVMHIAYVSSLAATVQS